MTYLSHEPIKATILIKSQQGLINSFGVLRQYGQSTLHLSHSQVADFLRRDKAIPNSPRPISPKVAGSGT